MNPIVKPCAAVVFAVGALAVYGTMAQPAADTPAKNTSPCASAEYHDFDFWVGDWDVFDVSDPKTKVAKVRVDRILGGCVLREDYQDTSGHKGQSFSIYDVSQKAWHQSWVTNRGQLLLLDGGLQSGNMVLRAVEHLGDGKEKHIRGTWAPVEGGVRETALTSTDGGKTWGSWFDLIFRPHTAGNSFSDDEKAVAALDDEYQAAVRTTMQKRWIVS